MVNSVGLLGMTLADATKAIRKLPYGPIRVVYCANLESPTSTPVAAPKHVVPEIRTHPEGGSATNFNETCSPVKVCVTSVLQLYCQNCRPVYLLAPL